MLKKFYFSAMLFMAPACLAAETSWQDTTDWQALTQEIDTLRLENGIAVASSLSNVKGTVWQYHNGPIKEGHEDNIDENSRFRAGSVSKTFIAVGLLQLVDQGKLDLDTPVSVYLPNVRLVNPWSETDPVRVKDLLSHTAGLRDTGLTELYSANGQADLPLDDVIANYEYIARWRPGTRQAYSNFGYLLAGHLLEQLTGESYENWLDTHILKPLNMTQSSFHQDEKMLATLISGHGSALSGGKYPVPVLPISVRPAGSLITTLHDLTRFSRMLLNEGELDGTRILSKASWTLMHSSAMDKHSVSHQGAYGLGIYPVNRESGRYFCHSGGIDGFLTQVCFSTDKNMAFVALSNNIELSGGMVFDKALEYIASPSLPEAMPLDFDITPWLGFYHPESARQEGMATMDRLFKASQVSFDGEQLIIKPLFGTADEYLYVGNQGFRPKDKQAINLTLTLDSQGQALIQETWDTYIADTSWYGPWLNYLFLTLGILVLITSLSAAMMTTYTVTLAIRRKALPTRFTLHLACLLLPLIFIGLYFCFSQLQLWALNSLSLSSISIWVISCLWPLTIVYFSWAVWQKRASLNLKRNQCYWAIAVFIQWGIAAYLIHFGTYNLMFWSE